MCAPFAGLLANFKKLQSFYAISNKSICQFITTQMYSMRPSSELVYFGINCTGIQYGERRVVCASSGFTVPAGVTKSLLLVHCATFIASTIDTIDKI